MELLRQYQQHCNRTISAVAFEAAPWVTSCYAKPNCTFRGVDYVFTSDVMDMIGYKLKVIPAMSRKQGKEIFKSGAADFLMLSQRLGDENFVNNFSYTPVPIMDRPIFTMKPYRYSSVNGFLLLSIFDVRVWVLLAAAFPFCYILYKLCKHFMHKAFTTGEKMKPGNYKISNTLRSSDHPEEIDITAPPKLIWTAWYLATMIALSTYANFLAIALSKGPSQLQNPFKTVEALLQAVIDKRCQFVYFELSILTRGILDKRAREHGGTAPLSPLEKLIFDAVNAGTEIQVDGPGDLTKTLLNSTRSQCLVGIDFESRKMQIEKEYPSLGVLHSTTLPRLPYVYYYNSRLEPCMKNLFNFAFTRGSSNSKYNRLMERYVTDDALLMEERSTKKRFNGADRQDKVTEDTPFPRRLTIGQVQDTYLILTTGVLLAVGLFVFENVINYRNNVVVARAKMIYARFANKHRDGL